MCVGAGSENIASRVSTLELKLNKFTVHERAVSSVGGLDRLTLLVERRRRPLFCICGVWQEGIQVSGQIQSAEIVEQIPEDYRV